MLDASVLGRPDDVAEDGARLDRGQLPGVADEDEPGLRAHRLEQPGHLGERDHRGLVDDHDVVGQPVAAVVAEAALAVRAPAEQAVQGRGARRAQLGADGVARVESFGGVVDGLLEARRGDRRGRGERDERLGPAGRLGLLGQQRDDAGDGRRLAGARAAGDDGEAMADRGGAGRALALVGVAGEEPREAVRRARPRRRLRAPRRRAPGGRRRSGAPRASSGRGRARCRRGAAAGSLRPLRPPRRGRSLAVVRSTARPPARPATRGRRPPRRRRSRSRGWWRGRRRRGRGAARGRRAPRPARPARRRRRASAASRRATWTSAASSTPAALKSCSRPVALVARRTSKRSTLDEAHAPSPRSSTSLSATTSALGGRQAKTPRGRAVDRRRVGGRPSRAGRGRGRRRGCARGRSRAGASAGSDAAPTV